VNPTLARIHLRNLERAWDGAEVCRRRRAEVVAAAPVISVGVYNLIDLRGDQAHDIDYYAWEASRIIKIAGKVIAAGLRGKEDVVDALQRLRESAPQLEAFRNAVTHVEDNRTADDVGGGVRIRLDGGVEYLVDPRHEQHDLLGELVRTATAALSTLAA